MGFPVGDYQERWQIPGMVQEGMQLERSFLLPVHRPRKQRQTHVNEGGIKRIQGILEPETMPGRQFPTFFHHRIKRVPENIGVAVVIGVAQGALRHRFQPQMIPLLLVAFQTYFNVTETTQMPRLGKNQHEQLLPTGKPFRVSVSRIAVNTFLKPITTNELHNLGKYRISTHGQSSCSVCVLGIRPPKYIQNMDIAHFYFIFTGQF